MTNAELRRCKSCLRYTLQETCPACGSPAGNPHPARWSPEDRYARYRRALLAEAARESSAATPAASTPTSEGAPPQH